VSDHSSLIGGRFPPLSSRDLEGKTFEIPADLPGTFNLVVLAFSRDHRFAVESWLPYFAGLEERFAGLEVWQVPTLDKGYLIFRGAIDGGLRAGITDTKVKAHTLTAYVDVRGLQRDLALAGRDEVELYLLDRLGVVQWHAAGGWTAETLAGLTAVLEGLPA